MPAFSGMTVGGSRRLLVVSLRYDECGAIRLSCRVEKDGSPRYARDDGLRWWGLCAIRGDVLREGVDAGLRRHDGGWVGVALAVVVGLGRQDARLRGHDGVCGRTARANLKSCCFYEAFYSFEDVVAAQFVDAGVDADPESVGHDEVGVGGFA